jgi:hypothetical protein
VQVESSTHFDAMPRVRVNQIRAKFVFALVEAHAHLFKKLTNTQQRGECAGENE